MQSMEDVYRQHAGTVYRYLFSLTHNADLAEELTQETFVRAIRASDRFAGKSSVTTWLCAIAKRAYLEYLRKHPSYEELDRVREAAASAEERLLERERKKALFSALHRAPEPGREVLYLRLFGGLSFAEIGEILGRTENWARVTFYRGKERLRKEMESDGNPL